MTSGTGTGQSFEQTAAAPPHGEVSRISGATVRHLYWAVPAATFTTAVVVIGLILAMHRPDWWPAFWASLAVSVVAAGASMLVLRTAAGKPADYAVTLAMGITLVRAGLTIVGIAAVVKWMKLAPEPTTFMACGFYAATLIVESIVMARAASAGQSKRPA